MKRIMTTCLIVGVITLAFVGCNDFLDVKPQGSINEDNVGSSPKSINGLITAAYSWMPAQSDACCGGGMVEWLVDIKSGNSYKGGAGTGDQAPWYQMEVFSLVTPSIGNNDGAWYDAYKGISRINNALDALNKAKESVYPMKTQRIAEMRFLRGRVYLKLKMRYRWIPYFTEHATREEIKNISNHPDSVESDLYLWKSILKDFQFAAKHLPAVQKDKGRPTKYAAMAQAAWTLMWMAYPQNEKNQVIGIKEKRLKQALEYLNKIINSGQYRLTPMFAHNYLASYDGETPGEIFSWQFSHDDGTEGTGNLNGGTPLNAPWWPPYFSCCDFHKPSYAMVNVFRTTNEGLPMFKNWNNTSAHHNYTPYFNNNTFDPRIGHTVAIPGLPWKYQTSLIFDSSAARMPAQYGYFSSLKENLQTDSPALENWFWMWNAKDVGIIRYDKVLLMKAEALIKLGREDEALSIINNIRKRATNSTKLLKVANNPKARLNLDYNISLYKPGVNCTWTQEFAWKALKWEYRLELAMEGDRWYNIVRWGIADEVMNEHFAKEVKRGREWLKDAHFTNGRDEYMPIPQKQMNWSKGLYKQNVGYR